MLGSAFRGERWRAAGRQGAAPLSARSNASHRPSLSCSRPRAAARWRRNRARPAPRRSRAHCRRRRFPAGRTGRASCSPGRRRRRANTAQTAGGRPRRRRWCAAAARSAAAAAGAGRWQRVIPLHSAVQREPRGPACLPRVRCWLERSAFAAVGQRAVCTARRPADCHGRFDSLLMLSGGDCPSLAECLREPWRAHTDRKGETSTGKDDLGEHQRARQPGLVFRAAAATGGASDSLSICRLDGGLAAAQRRGRHT